MVNTYGGYNRLYKNLAGHGFEEVAHRAGIASGPRWGFSVAAFDADNDGHDDLIFGCLAEPASLGEVYAYVHNEEWNERRPGADTLHSRFYINNGNGTYRDATRAAGLDGPIVAMGMNVGVLHAADTLT